MSDHDPGDAVPPGVAPVEPVPLTDEDRRVREKLEHLGEEETGAQTDEAARARWKADDEEVERITQTVQPHSDAPSRSGISGSGSGADGEGL